MIKGLASSLRGREVGEWCGVYLNEGGSGVKGARLKVRRV